MDEINDYMGTAFEHICTQYLIRQVRAGKLPFVPHTIGRWWGNNPVLKAQDDVDILAQVRLYGAGVKKNKGRRRTIVYTG